MPEPPYSVNYYQVNAGTGDCEIVLLLNNKISSKQTIEKAVLIDGGEPTAYYLMNIRKTFDSIRQAFKPEPLKFDAVIITHWDEEHYRGILELMSQDLDKVSGQVPWLKYDKDTKQPDSILYIPYRFPPGGNLTYVEGKETPPNLYLCLGNDKKLCKVISDCKNESPTSLPEPQPFDTNSSELIGRELFNDLYNKDSLKQNKANSPAGLAGIYSELKGRPGLFCVAANYRYLSGGSTEDKDKDTPVDSSLTNKSSIVCLVIWPENKQVTHYMAGDAPLALEEAVVRWIGRDLPEGQVKVVKASNHGARTSFPWTLCQKLNPFYILCSAGKAYEQPNWEFMFKVYSSMVTQAKMNACQIFFTNFPYYLRDGKQTTRFKVDERSLKDGSYLFKFLSAVLKKYPGKDAEGWIRSVLADVIFERFAWFNDDFSLKEAADARDDIQFILIKSPVGGEEWSANVERLSSKRRADSGSRSSAKPSATLSIPSSTSTATKPITTPSVPSSTSTATKPIATSSIPTSTSTATKPIATPSIPSSTGTATKPIATPSIPSSTGTATKPIATPSIPSSTGTATKPIATPSIPSSTATKPSVTLPIPLPIPNPTDYDDSTSNVFYVTSSNVDTRWRALIDALPSEFLMLSEKPEGKAKAISLESGSDSDYYDDYSFDPWLDWLSRLLNAGVDLAVFASLKDTDVVEIEHFELSLALLINGQTITLHFNFGETVGPGLDQPSIPFDPYKHFLHFGLRKGDPYKIPLWDLISYYRFEKAFWFQSDLKVDLDINGCDVWLGVVLGYYVCTFRLQASITNLTPFVEALKKIEVLKELLPDPSRVTVVVKRTMKLLESAGGNLPKYVSQLGFELSFGNKFKAVFFCSSESYLIAFRDFDSLGQLGKILEKAGCTNFQQTLDKIAKSFDILGASVEINKDFKIARVTVDVEVTFGYHNEGSQGISFLLTFAYPQFLFRASLITTEGAGPEWEKKMPDYEPLLEVVPKRTPSKNISILDLIPGLQGLVMPRGILNEITQATFQFDGSSVSFSGTLKSGNLGADAGDAQVPIISFSTLVLDASYNFSGSWSLSIAVTVGLSAGVSSSNQVEDGILFASVDYDSKTWKLKGGASNIKFSNLLSFFHKDEAEQVDGLLGSISIPSIFLSYEYSGKGTPSTFDFDGSMIISKNTMSLKYHRDGNGWSVEAGLVSREEYNLMDLLVDISGGADDLPDFFSTINLIPETMTLKCVKDSKKSTPTSALITEFNVTHKFGNVGMSFTLVQTSLKSGSSPTPVKKRLLSLVFTDLLPSFKIDAPVFGTLSNPVDGLELIWLNKPKTGGTGLLRKELDEINKTLLPKPPIHFKETKTQGRDTDVVISPGCHFMLLVNDNGRIQVALDYIFDGKQKQATKQVTFDEAPPPSLPTQSKAAVNKTTGPLSVANIGLRYEGGKLYLVFDASLSLGPISLSLLGFGLGIELGGSMFKNPQLDVTLSGLAAGLNKPPLTLDGMFKVVDHQTYSGGVIVGYAPYGVLAYGSYGSFKNFKTFFIFGELEGPLVELEFATIDGVKLGFGFNSRITYPTVGDVFNFPLVKGFEDPSVIQDAENSQNVLSILTAFDLWVHAQQNSLWFAAGLEVTAFKSLHLNAVAVLEVDPDVSVGLFARMKFDLPPEGRSFVHVELGIASRLILKEGLFTTESSLSPQSYVLDRSCSLSGGMALCYWFDPSPYAGEFVFSIGGYHAAFQAPPYYPNPQRLGMTWKYSNQIYIEGNAYFAITPKVCMGGGKLDLQFSAGPIYAYFIAYADFFIVWSPFHFMVDLGISIGVGVRGKFLWWNVDLHADVSADLHLTGPPFSGWVRVDAGIAYIDIHFGDSSNPPAPLTLDQFWQLLISSKPPGGRRELREETRDSDGITLAIESGSLPGKNRKIAAESDKQSWDVNPGNFSFLVQCRFALKEVKYGDAQVTSETEVYSKPMQSTKPITSELTITLTSDNDNDKFTLEPILKNVPSAQWGKYSKDDDPTHGKTTDYLCKGTNSTIEMLMGARVVGPGPKLSDDGIEKYKVAEAMYQDIMPPKTLPQERQPLPVLWKNKTLKDAKEAWLKNQDTVQAFTEQWEKAFKWQSNLNGKPPRHLLDKMDAFYLYVPMSTTKPNV